MDNSIYQESNDHLKRAEKSIPLGSQTFSKSKTQYPVGISPLYIDKAKGSEVWDIDGNKYYDLVNSLGAVTLGYQNKKIDNQVKKQLKKGTIFSLPGVIEAEVAELIIETVPSAEMVRFSKNGSDATSAAIRLARAYTGKTEIAFCGYHGWADWYIGATSMNKGVPDIVSALTHKFEYNNIDSLQEIFNKCENNIAAVILEPMNLAYPKNDFFNAVKKLAKKYNSVLIFDETITGYRFSEGGAQKEFAVIPDLTTLGKGIANGYPLAAIVGRKELMKEMENIFFSGTFGGELLSLAAAKTVIQMHLDYEITKDLAAIGENIATNLNKLIVSNGMTGCLTLTGHPTWKFLNWSPTEKYSSSVLKTYFMQEMFKRGVLVLSTHNVSMTITEKISSKILSAYDEVLTNMSFNIKNDTILENLLVDPITPLFSVR
jgi:glutamate-1-semialdehyde 2,1-aminomutase